MLRVGLHRCSWLGPEDCMSLCRVVRTQAFSFACLLLVVAALSGTNALAQEPITPKVDVFVGYQWLNPGGSVPTPGDPLTPFKLPSINNGFGASAPYNFT